MGDIPATQAKIIEDIMTQRNKILLCFLACEHRNAVPVVADQMWDRLKKRCKILRCIITAGGDGDIQIPQLLNNFYALTPNRINFGRFCKPHLWK